jgi:hypothetical protein
MTTKEAAHAYAARGWHVFPTIPGTKYPATGRGFYDAVTDAAQIDEWWEEDPARGVAVALAASGLFAVDIEVPEHEWVDRLEGSTWCQATASGGWHFVYRQPDGWEVPPIPVHMLADDVEIRGAGNYVLAAPTKIAAKHSKADLPGAYTVVDDKEPAEAPPWVLEAIRAAMDARAKTAPTVRAVSIGTVNTSAQDRIDELAGLVRSAVEGDRNNTLAAVSASMGRVVAGGYVSESEARNVLEGAASAWGEDAKSAKTIARGLAYGQTLDPWYPDGVPADPLFDLHVEEILSTAEADDGLAVVEVQAPVHDVEDRDAVRAELCDRLAAHSPVARDLVAACKASSPYYQPGYVTGAVVALGAALAGRRHVWGGLTSSLYVLTVGRSGSGKGGPQSVVQQALGLWPELEGPGAFSSWQSAFAAHGETDTAICWVIDEYEAVLSVVLDRRASESTKGLRGFLLRMATIGTGTYSRAKSLAAGGGKEVIHAPGIVILGAATPEALFAALGRASVEDGLLPRHLVTAEQSVLPRRRWERERAELSDTVRRAVLACKDEHEKWVSACLQAEGKLYDGGREVRVQPGAQQYLRSWGESIEDARRGASAVPDAVLARAVEQAQRVSLALAQLAQPRAHQLEINVATVCLACDLVAASVAQLAVYLGQHGGETEHERSAKRVLSVLRLLGPGGAWVSRGALRAKLRHLKARDLDEVLAMLVETGEVEAAKAETGGRPKLVYRVTA